MSFRQRLIISCIIGVITGLVGGWYQLAFANGGAGDITMPLCMGEALWRGDDPYIVCRGFQSDGVTPNTLNPVTTAIITLLLLPLPRFVAAGVFLGLSAAILAWALTRSGEAWRLLTFLAFPFWAAVQTVQWASLLLAVYFWPALLALTLAKPHVGAAVALNVPWRRWPVMVTLLLGLLSLLWMPAWPLAMLGGVEAPGDYRPPVFSLPGAMLLLAALRWRAREARLLLFLALAPQRTFYDQLLVFGVVRTWRELLVLIGCSWLCYLSWFLLPLPGIPWFIWLIYLPALVIVLRQGYPHSIIRAPLALGSNADPPEEA